MSYQKYLDRLDMSSQNSGASDGSQWWSEPNNQKIISINPANGEELADVFPGSAEDYEKMIVNSRKVFHQWRLIPAPKRGELIRQIGNELRNQKQYLGELVSLESGKSKVEGLGEVQEMIDMADFAVGLSRMLYGKTIPSERPQHSMLEQWHPLGVVGVITAFNFPVAVWAWNAFLAAVCGNTIIWKPSSKVALCAIAVQKICNKIMASNGYSGIFSLLITDQASLMSRLVSDPRIELISFTGSTPVGREIAEKTARRLGKCLLELGGNNAIVIDQSADLDLAVQAIFFSALGAAGQRCTTVRRLIIHHSIYQALVQKLVSAYEKVSIGDPLDEKNTMGPLIDQSAVENYQSALKSVQAAGGEIIFGGQVLNQPGFYVQPTLVKAENHWEVVQRETFAPILYLMTFQTLEEAIQLHNQVPQGLSSALFTNQLQNAELFLSSIGSDCGIANINVGTSGAEIGGAFGGEKASGGGREAGSDSWKAYMRRQTNTINSGSKLPLAQGIEFKHSH